MSVIKKIKIVYNDLKPAQKKIADYFMSADFDAINGSIGDIAKKIGVSIASISRFCRYLGFDNFQHFKITYSRDIKYEPDTILPIFNMNDDPALCIRKVFSEAITNLQATEGTIDASSLKTLVDKIKASRALYFFGLGGSGGVGYLGELLFSHLGYIAHSINDPYRMIVSAGHSDEKTVIVGLSHSGCTREVIESIKIAKSNGAFTSAITNYKKSPLAGIADLVLFTACHERRVHFAQSNSMVSQLTIIHALYVLTASKSRDSIIKKVNIIEENVKKDLRIKY